MLNNLDLARYGYFSLDHLLETYLHQAPKGSPEEVAVQLKIPIHLWRAIIASPWFPIRLMKVAVTMAMDPEAAREAAKALVAAMGKGNTEAVKVVLQMVSYFGLPREEARVVVDFGDELQIPISAPKPN